MTAGHSVPNGAPSFHLRVDSSHEERIIWQHQRPMPMRMRAMRHQEPVTSNQHRVLDGCVIYRTARYVLRNGSQEQDYGDPNDP